MADEVTNLRASKDSGPQERMHELNVVAEKADEEATGPISQCGHRSRGELERP